MSRFEVFSGHVKEICQDTIVFRKTSQARCNQEQETNMHGRDVYQRIDTEKQAIYAIFSSLQAVVISGSDIVGSSIHFCDFLGYSFLNFLYSLEITGNHNCKSSFGGTCF